MHRVLLILLICLVSCPAFALEPLDTEVTQDISVLADPSLTVPLVRLARRYAELYTVPVSAEFGSSKNQLTEIRAGQEGNVFITAKAAWIKQLQQEGQMDVYSRTTIARNRLAFVAPRGKGQGMDSPQALSVQMAEEGDDALFALGDPEYVAEGTYTLEALGKLKLAGDFEPHYSVLGGSHMLKNMVAAYDAYGAVFYTDALLYPSMSLIAVADEETHQPIAYQAGVLVGDNMENARHFLGFLKSAEGYEVFQRYGFLSAF